MCSDKVQISICDLPHYPLSILLSYLDSDSLYALSQTCTFLKDSVEDPKLWKYINFRNTPNDLQKFKYSTDRVWEQTTHLLSRGNRTYSIPRQFALKIHPFLNLNVLALEHQHISGSKTSMRDFFPSGLVELSLKGTYIENKAFFQQTWCNFMKLKVIILDECEWLGCDVLMSLSRYENLEIVSVVQCPKIHVDTVPYSSVAKYGFKKLKVLDARFTGIGGEVLRTFYGHHTVQRLYFQSFQTSEIDYGFDFENSIKPPLTNKVTTFKAIVQSISDNYLRDYRNMESFDQVDNIFDSFLYCDPYPECNCSTRSEPVPDNPILDLPLSGEDYVFRITDDSEPKYICKKHKQALDNLPKDVKDLLVQHRRVGIEESDSDEDDNRCCCLYNLNTKIIIMKTSNISEEENRAAEDRPNPEISFYTLGNGNSNGNGFPAKEKLSSNDNSSSSSPSGETSREDSSSSESDETNERENNSGINRRTASNLRKRLRQYFDSEQPSKKKGKYSGSKPSTSQSESKSKKEEKGLDSDDELSEEGEGMPSNKSNERASTSRRNSRSARYTRYGRRTLQRLCNFFEPEQQKRKEMKYSRNNEDERLVSREERMQEVEAMPRPEELNNDDNSNHDSSSDDLGVVPESLANNYLVREQPEEGNYVRIVRDQLRVPGGRNKKISLKRLSLRGYSKITDCSLDYLRNLNIELLDLTYTKVTKTGIESYLRYHPDCRIIHPLYCTCKPRNPF